MVLAEAILYLDLEWDLDFVLGLNLASNSLLQIYCEALIISKLVSLRNAAEQGFSGI